MYLQGFKLIVLICGLRTSVFSYIQLNDFFIKTHIYAVIYFYFKT